MDFGPMDFFCFGVKEEIEATDFEEAIEAYLFDSLNISVWYESIPEKASLPCIVYQTINNDPMNSIDGDTGLSQAEMQIDCYDVSRKLAYAQSERVRLKLNGFRGYLGGIRFSIMLDTRFTDRDPSSDGSDSGTWITRSSYTVFYNESVPEF